MENLFIKAANFQPLTETENGAKAYYTTGSALVDQFGLAGNYRGREIGQVFDDQEKLWEENVEAAIRLPFYLRLITRNVKIADDKVTEKVMNGQGGRDESFKRFLWLAKYHPEQFYKNAWLIPSVGSWKDLWTLMYYDKKFDVNALDRKLIYEIIKQGLESETFIDLIKKFMPRIKSGSKTNTDWAKITNEFAKEFANTYKMKYGKYNHLKSSGKAHDFQKLISNKEYDKLKWNKIPGRALSMLVNGKFISNHNLEKSYLKWLDTQETVKFTGYPYELVIKANERYSLPLITQHTLNKQFLQLVETARANGKITENVLVCLDTSGSMNCQVTGIQGVRCADIANSLALFFAELNTGAFHNKVMSFDRVSKAHDLKGGNFCNNLKMLPRVPCGGTNFQSVIDELIRIKNKHPEIPMSDWPTTILAVSDMQFNMTHPWTSRQETTNFEESVNKLKSVFPEEYVDSIKFVWWNCASRSETFDGDATTQGCLFVSGFDGSFLNTLLGIEPKEVVDKNTGKVKKVQPSAEEVAFNALNQEIFNYVQL